MTLLHLNDFSIYLKHVVKLTLTSQCHTFQSGLSLGDSFILGIAVGPFLPSFLPRALEKGDLLPSGSFTCKKLLHCLSFLLVVKAHEILTKLQLKLPNSAASPVFILFSLI